MEPYRDPAAPVAPNVGEELTIFMTDRRPVTINTREWPVLASALQTARLDEEECVMVVRQHADGRRLVYGWRECKGAPSARHDAGYLVEADDVGDKQTIFRLELVEIALGASRLADRCINALPAERL